MTTIKATCPTCGEVALTPEQLEIRIIAGGSHSVYLFTCPVCDAAVDKPADERIVKLLASSGVRVVTEEPSDEPPPFTRDDLLDFHELLQTEHWFERVLSDGPVR